MRNPDNLNKINYDAQKEQTLTLLSIPEYDKEDYDLNQPKVFKKYIDTIEKLVRGSFEYQRMIYFLKNYMDMNQCSIYDQVSGEGNYNIKIEIHHEPITLYDMVLTIYNKRAAMREPLSVDMVAKETVYNHYKLRVGLIPLAETVHELVHNQYVFVPTTAVFGKYWEFIDAYKQFIDIEIMDTLKKIEIISKNYSIGDEKKLLGTNLIYIDATDSLGSVDLDEVKDLLLERVKKKR